MRKMSIHKAGSYGVLKLEEHPSPTPSDGERLIEVEAAGVNYADCIVRMGLYESAKKYVGYPITPGFEFAGRVNGEGPLMMGVSRFGGYASKLCVPVHQIWQAPPGFSAIQAATFPTMFMTAWFALRELARPRPGYRMLVHSAAGGVGGALCQLGRALGAEVTGVVGSAAKVETARGFGAHHVIDKSSEDLWAKASAIAPKGFEIILDANGATTLGQSYQHLAQPGKVVVYGFHSMIPRTGGKPNWAKLAFDYARTPRFHPMNLTNDNKSVMAFNLSYLFDQNELLSEAMSELVGLVAEGKLKPAPVQTFPLEKAGDAHRAIESGTTVGKLCLTM